MDYTATFHKKEGLKGREATSPRIIKFKFVFALIRPMKLGLLINRINYEEKQILKACEQIGVDLIQFNNQRTTFEISKEKNIDPPVDVFLQRSLSIIRSIYSTAILESKGYTVVNNSYCISKCADKLLTSLLLAEHGIPTPKTMVAFTPDSAEEIMTKSLSYPVILKPTIGSWGRMVAKLNDVDGLRAVLEVRENLGDAWQNVFYMQDYVDATKARKDAPTDIRVFYIGGQCVAAMGRYHGADEFRSNIAIGGTAKPYPITPEVEQLCGKIAKIFQGDILGIDLMESKDGLICIEVNGTPGFEGLMNATGINIGMKIAEYLKEKYGK
jgi:[lysine-biosynthesis-protein LysW]--L-2-aminoadipate ligase